MDDQQQLELAKELRATLDTVISDPAERQTVETELDNALALTGEERDDRLGAVLGAHAETRKWMRERDEDPERLKPLAGRVTAPLGIYYACPEGDQDFVQEYVGQPVPICTKHEKQMEAVEE